MMTPQILKSLNFTKTQKSRYLENENLLFLKIKNHELHIKGYCIGKNTFILEVTFISMILRININNNSNAGIINSNNILNKKDGNNKTLLKRPTSGQDSYKEPLTSKKRNVVIFGDTVAYPKE